MVAITGGVASAGPAAGPGFTAFAATAPAGNEARVAEALLRCMGRWGLSKTTMEDVAREAGLSRATVYRLFPGGKTSILVAAAQSEVRSLLALLTAAVHQMEELESALVRSVHVASCFLEEHEAFVFMREHEPVALEQVLAFDELDTIFATAGPLFGPALDRFLDPDEAQRVGVWLARLVVSYLATPSGLVDLRDIDDVRRLVTSFVLPGIPAGSIRPHPTDRVPPTTSRSS